MIDLDVRTITGRHPFASPGRAEDARVPAAAPDTGGRAGVTTGSARPA